MSVVSTSRPQHTLSQCREVHSGYAYYGTVMPGRDCVSDYNNNTYIGDDCLPGLTVTRTRSMDDRIYSMFARPVLLTFSPTSTSQSSAGSASTSQSSGTIVPVIPVPYEPSSTAARTSALFEASSTTAASTNTVDASSVHAFTHHSSGLSKGCIAGIVIGAVAGIALVVAAVFVLLRRKHRHTEKASAGGAQAGSELPADGMYKEGMVGTAVRQVCYAQHPNELDAGQVAHETGQSPARYTNGSR